MLKVVKRNTKKLNDYQFYTLSLYCYKLNTHTSSSGPIFISFKVNF